MPRMTPNDVYHLALKVLADHPLDDSGLCEICRVSPCRARSLAQATIEGRPGELRPPYDPMPTTSPPSGSTAG